MQRKLGGGFKDAPTERPLLGLGRTTREDEEALRQQRVSNYRQCVENTEEVRQGVGWDGMDACMQRREGLKPAHCTRTT